MTNAEYEAAMARIEKLLAIPEVALTSEQTAELERLSLACEQWEDAQPWWQDFISTHSS